MTRSQIHEIIRDICTPCSVEQIQAANLQLKRILGGHLVRIDIAKPVVLYPVVLYTVYPDDTNDYDIILFDFIRKKIM